MILAAGRGERMRPLTDTTPKPLLKAGGRALIEHHLERLGAAGIREVVINHGRLGHLIEAAVGDGGRYGLRIRYSPEGDTPLETGGGVFRALPLLGEGPFLLVNADVWSTLSYADLPADPGEMVHLVLVPNPAHHPGGDFSLSGGRVGTDGAPRWTYSGIGVYRPQLFADCTAGRFPLAPLLRRAATAGQITGRVYDGRWLDVGTPDRLRQLETLLATAS